MVIVYCTIIPVSIANSGLDPFLFLSIRIGRAMALNYLKTSRAANLYTYAGLTLKPLKPLPLAEQSLESAMVLVVLVNALALIAPADDMKQRAGKMYARASCHVSF